MEVLKLKRELANISSMVITVVFVSAFLISGPAFAVKSLERSDLVVQEFQLQSPNGAVRRLVLHTPLEWEADLHVERDSSRIRIQTRAGSVANLIGVLNKTIDDHELRALATTMGLDHMDQAEESELELIQFSGDQARGYYFILTDNNPAPGEWKFLTSGFFVAEDSLWMVRMLSHERGGSDELDLIESLKHIRFY